MSFVHGAKYIRFNKTKRQKGGDVGIERMNE